MLIGTLDALRRYPIKSLGGEALESVEVEESGIPGDREAALIVAAGGARVGKTYRGKEHERLHLIRTAADATAAAAERGVQVELQQGQRFFDDAPISLLVDRWLDTLDAHLGYAVEWQRFRPNFFVRAAPEFTLEETALVNRELTLGTVRLRVRCPIERCVAVTYHPRGEASDPEILRFLAQQRNAWLGIYCDVVEPGMVKVGDAVILRPSTSSG